METDIQKIYSDLTQNFPKSEIYQNHPLAPYTTVKIGGPADIFIHTHSSDEFKNILVFLNGGEDNITILGNGSNVLISDSGLRGIVIKNDSQEIEILPENKVKASSGTQLAYLISFTLEHNLLGLEEFAYIPSTIGGAIAGQIHGTKGLISDYLDSVEKYGSFIISAVFKLSPGDSAIAKQQLQETIQKKSLVQSMNSLGSVFKNTPNQDPTGLIIDQKLGLKGFAIGDAQISPKHANFIINNGQATAQDYLAVINHIQSQAKAKLGIQFEPEIKFLGNF